MYLSVYLSVYLSIYLSPFLSLSLFFTKEQWKREGRRSFIEMLRVDNKKKFMHYLSLMQSCISLARLSLTTHTVFVRKIKRMIPYFSSFSQYLT